MSIERLPLGSAQVCELAHTRDVCEFADVFGFWGDNGAAILLQIPDMFLGWDFLFWAFAATEFFGRAGRGDGDGGTSGRL